MRRVVTFLFLVFALSAPLWLLGWLAGGRLTSDLPVSAVVFVVPGLAAALLTRREGGRAAVMALLRRAVDWRLVEGRMWLLVAIAMPFGITLLSLLMMAALGEPLPELRFPVVVSAASLLVYLVAGAFEEIGWTGYATDPLLARWPARTAALFLGVVMVAFHVVQLVQHGRPAAWIAWWCLSTVTLRVLKVWLYVNTRSVFVVTLMHAMSNLASIGPFLYYGPAGLSLEAQRASAVVTALVAVSVMWWWGPRHSAGAVVRETGR